MIRQAQRPVLELRCGIGRATVSLAHPGADVTGLELSASALVFTSGQEATGVWISMGGRERALDNVPVKQLWRSGNCERVCLYAYETIPELEKGLHQYFMFYDHERSHQSLS